VLFPAFKGVEHVMKSARALRLASCIGLSLTLSTQLSLAEAPQEAPNSVVQGFIRFMAYHEAGHLLLNQIQGINAKTWPIDDIERYADEIAAILLVPDADDPDGVEEIIGAANGWLKAGAGYTSADPHAPPVERAYNIICYVYGSDPEGFKDFEQYVQPDWNCAEKFKATDDEVEEGFVNNTDGKGIPIELTYAAPTAEMRDARDYLHASGILEDLVSDIEFDFKLTRPTKLVAMSCKGQGDEGTFHFDTFQNDDPSKNFDRIAICYELVDMWMKAKINLDP
jgi:hypothetical protein